MGNLINLNDKVTTFLKSKNEVVDSLNDYSLLTYLAFLTDITQKLKYSRIPLIQNTLAAEYNRPKPKSTPDTEKNLENIDKDIS